ncbi:MAG: phosphodiester glycosidase family protein [Pseudolactococcus laudensis]
MKRKTKKSRVGLFIALLFFLILVILFVILLKPFEKKTTGKSQVSGNSPVKVDPSKSAGIISSSSVVASDHAEEVENTGDATWVQVHSKGKGEKFQDISTDNIKIYKAHNPQVLKTATSKHPALAILPDVMAQYPDALIMNASGFNMETGDITGFQINNGALFTNWGENKRAHEAFIINKDGSMTTYDSSTPASQILANGAEQSYSFGKILIKKGKVQENDGSVNWMIHSFIGNDKQNNLYLMISETNAGYENIMDQIKNLNLANLVLMDGGGSSQMGLNGQTIVPSQDNRQVGDFIVLK